MEENIELDINQSDDLIWIYVIGENNTEGSVYRQFRMFLRFFDDWPPDNKTERKAAPSYSEKLVSYSDTVMS